MIPTHKNNNLLQIIHQSRDLFTVRRKVQDHVLPFRRPQESAGPLEALEAGGVLWKILYDISDQ